MAREIVLCILAVLIYQVQSQSAFYPNSNTQSSTPVPSDAIIKFKAKASGKPASSATQASSASSSNAQTPSTSTAASTSQSQTIPVHPSNPNQGIKASPQLQIMPGQGFNLQAIPVSQLRSQMQQRHQNQNNVPRPFIQASPSSIPPQMQPSPVQLIQPSLSGPASVITSPVSTITIPPSSVTTIIDNSLSNSLANALQMMIANEFLNSAVNNNMIKDGVKVPLVETVVPPFDIAAFLQALNAQQIKETSQTECEETPQVATPQVATTSQPQQYDWTAIQNFLNQQGYTDKAAVPEVSPSSYMPDQILEPISANPTPEVTEDCQCPHLYPAQNSYDASLETLAAYLGCSVADLGTNCPVIPQIVFPEEIPAQLICNYGYMPTTVPVVSFSVQPLPNCGDGGNFIVGCPC